MRRVLLATIIGLPGSGKSTLCERLYKLKTNECQVVWIEYDQLIPLQLFSPKSDNSDWKDWRHAIIGCLEKLLALWKGVDFAQDLSEKENVVWLKVNKYSAVDAKEIIVLLDDNFYYCSMRRSFYNLARKYSCSYASVVCKCAMDICFLRNCTRSNPVSKDTIRNMETKFEWPDPINNSWEKHIFTISSSQEDVYNAASLLWSLKLLLSHPIVNESSVNDEERNKDRLINLDSLLHNADVHLRKVTSHTLKSRDSLWRIQHAKVLSNVKAECLRKLHEMISRGNSIWTIGNCQQIAEKLFYEKMNGILNNKLLHD
ncbi:L-seryl-tRNA(Sec) kinase isoform 2 [Schistosoma japonicum]|nr:L-seryl-tRNA(Sec) kinase isoform 2 [Schistosoma japonicum]